MDLIIKPTELCNFACTFCSSTDITDNKTDVLNLDYIARFLDRFPDTNTIIVNGGDPLMLKPDYYWDILKLLEERDMKETIVGFTTNLWDFYKRPDKWTELFRHPQFSVCTSFNYGDSRRISKNRVFTEADFLAISDLFLERVGYRPDFISVIDEHNRDTAIDNVRLAKRLGVECKLNLAMVSGRQKEPFLISDVHELYLEIYDEGLMPWEYNTKQMVNALNSYHTTCPIARDCDTGIRNIHPNGEYYSCGSFGDDRKFPIDFDKEMESDTIATPLSREITMRSMHDGCFGCELFALCNGCRKTIRDTQQAGLVEKHCNTMTALKPRLLEAAEKEPYAVGGLSDRID